MRGERIKSSNRETLLKSFKYQASRNKRDNYKGLKNSENHAETIEMQETTIHNGDIFDNDSNVNNIVDKVN